jgi:hypothetical protein
MDSVYISQRSHLVRGKQGNLTGCVVEEQRTDQRQPQCDGLCFQRYTAEAGGFNSLARSNGRGRTTRLCGIRGKFSSGSIFPCLVRRTTCIAASVFVTFPTMRFHFFLSRMQTPTPFSSQLININAVSLGDRTRFLPKLGAAIGTGYPTLSFVLDTSPLSLMSIKFEDHERFHTSLVDYRSNGTTSTFQHPHCVYSYPVRERPRDKTSKVVAVLLGLLPFDRYLVNLLPKGVKGIDAVLRNRDQVFTYRLHGNSVSVPACSLLQRNSF